MNYSRTYDSKRLDTKIDAKIDATTPRDEIDMLKLFTGSPATRLTQAIERDDADALTKWLRKASPELLSQPVDNGLLATELAIDAQRPKLLTLLLNAGCDANAVGAKGLPLSWRCLTTHGLAGYSLELLAALLRAGADANSCDSSGTPLLHACFDYCQPARLMLHLSRLLEAGARIDSLDAAGRSILQRALHSDRRELIQFLIHSGAALPDELSSDTSASDSAQSDLNPETLTYARRCQQDYRIRQQFLGA
jgi:ankyrin repeat protein